MSNPSSTHSRLMVGTEAPEVSVAAGNAASACGNYSANPQTAWHPRTACATLASTCCPVPGLGAGVACCVVRCSWGQKWQALGSVDPKLPMTRFMTRFGEESMALRVRRPQSRGALSPDLFHVPPAPSEQPPQPAIQPTRSRSLDLPRQAADFLAADAFGAGAPEAHTQTANTSQATGLQPAAGAATQPLGTVATCASDESRTSAGDIQQQRPQPHAWTAGALPRRRRSSWAAGTALLVEAEGGGPRNATQASSEVGARVTSSARGRTAAPRNPVT
jgi:hypothetical protein